MENEQYHFGFVFKQLWQKFLDFNTKTKSKTYDKQYYFGFVPRQNLLDLNRNMY